MTHIYLDHNATTPLLPEAADALDRAQRAGYANPASRHAAGRRARQAIEEAREAIGTMLGADVTSLRGDRVVFTSGGTETNNLALRGLTEYSAPSTRYSVLVSAVEHPSIHRTAEMLGSRGVVIEPIPVDRRGRIDVADVAARLRPETRLVSVMLGNNETGVIQPMAELAALCRSRGVLLHTDAVQAVGKIDVNFAQLGVDAMSVAAHKFHGPPGIGLLIVRRDVAVEPQLFGGFQQGGLRPGTESTALVLGFRTALEAWHRERSQRTEKLAALRDELEARITAECGQVVIHGREVPRLPQTSCIAFLGLNRQTLFMALDQAGVACSTGSACASGSSEPSPTLVAMKCPADEIESSLRFSVGATTTAAEVAEGAARIISVVNDLRRRKEARKMPSAGRLSSRSPI